MLPLKCFPAISSNAGHWIVSPQPRPPTHWRHILHHITLFIGLTSIISVSEVRTDDNLWQVPMLEDSSAHMIMLSPTGFLSLYTSPPPPHPFDPLHPECNNTNNKPVTMIRTFMMGRRLPYPPYISMTSVRAEAHVEAVRHRDSLHRIQQQGFFADQSSYNHGDPSYPCPAAIRRLQGPEVGRITWPLQVLEEAGLQDRVGVRMMTPGTLPCIGWQFSRDCHNRACYCSLRLSVPASGKFLQVAMDPSVGVITLRPRYPALRPNPTHPSRYDAEVRLVDLREKENKRSNVLETDTEVSRAIYHFRAATTSGSHGLGRIPSTVRTLFYSPRNLMFRVYLCRGLLQQSTPHFSSE